MKVYLIRRIGNSVCGSGEDALTVHHASLCEFRIKPLWSDLPEYCFNDLTTTRVVIKSMGILLPLFCKVIQCHPTFLTIKVGFIANEYDISFRVHTRLHTESIHLLSHTFHLTTKHRSDKFFDVISSKFIHIVWMKHMTTRTTFENRRLCIKSFYKEL